jgi:hypothetical protein
MPDNQGRYDEQDKQRAQSKEDNQDTQVEMCPYCGIREGTTEDHVIPRCLFSGDKPRTYIKVMACNECNNQKKSRDDDYLRDMLLVDVDSHDHPRAQALLDKLLRSVEDDRSLIARIILREYRILPVVTESGLYVGEIAAVDLNAERVQAMFGRIVSGLAYGRYGFRYPENTTFDTRRISRKEADQLISVLAGFGSPGSTCIDEEVFCCMPLHNADRSVWVWALEFYESVWYQVMAVTPDAPAEFHSAREARGH